MRPEAAIIVIFGITGDLAGRYLLPALYHLFKDDLLSDNTKIVGITRGDTTTQELFNKVEVCVNEVDKVCDPVAIDKMQQATTMFKMDLEDPASYDGLLGRLNEVEVEAGICLNRLYYLSIPPASYHGVVRLLGDRGLNASCLHGNAQTRLLVEKPFGYDLASAQKLIDETAASFKEEQVFRIDHYLAKQTVRHLLQFRLENPRLEAIWNSANIKSIEISAKEKIGVEGRAAFYEPLGALRDFVQSHLMQLMALVAMDLPGKMDAQLIHADKKSLLEKVEPAVSSKAKRGQYDGYRQEIGNPESVTETYAEVELSIGSERWQGTVFKLLTGKSLDERRSAISVTFKDGGQLSFNIQPDEMIEANQTLEAAAGQLSTHLSKTATQAHPDSYEKVLLDAIAGDPTLFATSEEVLESWRVLQPIIDNWQQSATGLTIYKAGAASIND